MIIYAIVMRIIVIFTSAQTLIKIDSLLALFPDSSSLPFTREPGNNNFVVCWDSQAKLPNFIT